MNCLGLFFIRSSGKGKKQVSLHYTAAQLLEKGVLVEIEDLPTSQYVSLEGRISGPNLGGGWGISGLGTGWERVSRAAAEGAALGEKFGR